MLSLLLSLSRSILGGGGGGRRGGRVVTTATLIECLNIPLCSIQKKRKKNINFVLKRDSFKKKKILPIKKSLDGQ